MAYHIKDESTDRKLRKLARAKGTTMAEALREALDHELAREAKKTSLWERLAPARDMVKANRSIPGPIDWDALKREEDANWGL
jgi:hypothetical protein